MKITSRSWLLGLMVVATTAAHAADRFWTNVFNSDFLAPTNWSPQIVPGAADNANFTNANFPSVSWSASRTNANLFVGGNGIASGFSASIGTNFWLLTNSFVLGQSAGRTGSVNLLNGLLCVTNAGGTARLIVGQGGRGSLGLLSGSVVADHFLATNTTATLTNSILSFLSSSLTVQHGSQVFFTNTSLRLNSTTLNLAGGTHTWGLGGSTTELVVGFGNSTLIGATVSGVGTVWSNRCRLLVGSGNNGGTLLFVVNGAALRSTDSTVLGQNSAATNAMAVADPGSNWRGTSATIGNVACTNARLFVVNGGQVFLNALTAGGGDDAVSNLVVVADSNSFLSNGVVTYIGFGGRGNTLGISNGAAMLGGQSFIGLGAPFNRAIVSGTNSTWTNNVSLTIGSDENSNRLEVVNGGVVSSGTGLVGGTVSTLSNTASISGPGSLWVMPAGLTIGNAGRGNALTVSNQGGVVSGNGNVGFGASSTNNRVLLTGAGSSWTNLGLLTIGRAGASGQVRVEFGAYFRTLHLEIGSQSTARSNLFEVDASANADVLGNVTVGITGAVNRFTVNDQSSLAIASNLVVGAESDSTNNVVTIGNDAVLTVGSGTNGQLNVRRGTCVLNDATISAPLLLLTNPQSRFDFRGGLLSTRGAVISNGAPFVVGRSGELPGVWAVRAGASDHLVFGSLFLGSNIPFNRLLITNGATLSITGNGEIGATGSASSNTVLLAGSGSRWLMGTDLHFGITGAVNRLVVSNGAFLRDEIGLLGQTLTSTNNEAVITGAGSVWSNLVSLFVGSVGSGNRLVVSNGAVVASGFTINVGGAASSTNNRVVVNGGTLLATNAAGSGQLDIRRGTNVLSSGSIHVDRLLLTNSASRFEFNGGTLLTKSTTNNNGIAFGVGDGANAATFNLGGTGTHFFANGLSVNSNGSMIGNGTIIGSVTIQPGGTLSPGTSVGKLVFNTAPTLLGQVALEISKDGTTLTNDQVQLSSGGISYSGSLVVTKLGPTALSGGDRFQLFSAGSYLGSFSPLTLPPLSAGLSWTNKLAVDGSIEVLGRPSPQIATTVLSGTNVVISGNGGPTNATYFVLASTNVALPLANWTRILTNQFDSSGNFTFTNVINPGVPQRFYILQVP